ncbi:alpha/beta hydrolase [Nocardia mangyaensis]|nr:alpha/beta hydrolase [Nocardia mangyaensis]MDO3650373.1 alpha/beta hydrolase [Nocardia mangyaensis]
MAFVHGAGMERSMFDAQVEALTAGGYRVVTWDLRGHGESIVAPGARFAAADALATWRRCCGSARSIGLCSLAIRSGESRAGVRSDARHAGGGADRAGFDVEHRAAVEVRASARGAVAAMIPARTLPRLMAKASAVTPSAITRTEATFARMPKRVFLDMWRATVSFVEPDPDYCCPVPLALTRGARDRTGNIATAMPRWAQAEGITEHAIPDAGHILTWDAPEATSKTLLRILDQWDLGNPAPERGE